MTTTRGNFDANECYAKLDIAKTAIEDEQQALAAKLVELEQAPNERWIPFMSNGKPGKSLELRALFERFLEEVGH